MLVKYFPAIAFIIGLMAIVFSLTVIPRSSDYVYYPHGSHCSFQPHALCARF